MLDVIGVVWLELGGVLVYDFNESLFVLHIILKQENAIVRNSIYAYYLVLLFLTILFQNIE